ncbi:hypothetical protein B0T19DRAFT_263533 [Cercophora scortea]|uniref:F-box domain-containing protein n=1 Tax=Cercophora scortea TaxID=314031 RepID=A0AAE0M6P0_9PEZI|nr:hypothetical protein B0T19DRAFT_263533 [Cercophora scortea]
MDDPDAPQSQAQPDPQDANLTNPPADGVDAAAPGPAGGPDPTPSGPHLIHALIGHGPGGLSETVRNSIGGLSETVRNSVTSLASHHDFRLRKEKEKLPDLEKGHIHPLGKSESLRVDGDEDALSKKQPVQPPPVEPSPLHLLTLPPEIQSEVLRHLDFPDLVNIRRTCHQLRAFASPHHISILMGPGRLKAQLERHCKCCLAYDAFQSHMIRGSLVDPAYPLSNACFKCALKANDHRLRPGNMITLANGTRVYVCRWCGMPVDFGFAAGNEQFHRRCYSLYNDKLVHFFFIGCIQLGLGFVSAVLAWIYFRNIGLVLGSTVASFLLLWMCLGIIIIRGNTRRSNYWTLLCELAILWLWMPPVYHIASAIASRSPGDAPIPKSTIACLVIFVLYMLFRLINLAGNIILMGGYDITRCTRGNVPRWRRLIDPVLRALVFWTYPQSIQK